ncbi:unnamed protein product [Rotaria sp. Silwood2]|nr:unnamed protein product [Rotaria sp. Silwood2]CAF2672710.1 unnamed protein product [Rotaria sp. Silwood2]CAF3085444.1 unnamed protein product [Rotaria sp. Silwood2]CAF4020590.1 unnamed protein product [Rotaria sp. Silwood2]CAF4251603.1 unnamed protein product [Rotaria sp. Silwood2]
MSINTNASLETSNITINKSDELVCRTKEFKQSLMIWRNALLPINNLLEWEHKYDSLIIFGIITFIFLCIRQINPPILTLASCIVLIIVLIDVLAPVGIPMIFKNEDWTSTKEAKYTRLCEHIATFEQHIKQKCELVLKMRKERPLMYLMVGSIFLGFIAFCFQNIDNILLCYLSTLSVCLTPGIHNRQLISLIHQYINGFWNNKKIVSSYTTEEKRTQ